MNTSTILTKYIITVIVLTLLYNYAQFFRTLTAIDFCNRSPAQKPSAKPHNLHEKTTV